MELFGDFEVDQTKTYKFTVRRIVFWNKYYEGVLGINGTHAEGKSNKDVEAISFTNLPVGSFPRLLSCFFPNLRAVTVNNCGLETITKQDLNGLTNMNQLSLNGNKITTLPNDLFESTPNIEIISFYGNRIRYIGDSIFDQVSYLKYANFKVNLTIDQCFKDGRGRFTFEDLKAIIHSNCQPDNGRVIDEYFLKLKAFDSFLTQILS